MTPPACDCEPNHNDYGTSLYSKSLFRELFPEFGNEQEKAATHIWSRIISRCGNDPDLPHIKRIVDYGCGEGTFLTELAKAGSNKNLTYIGLDCSAEAINLANAKPKPENVRFLECNPCPNYALRSITNPSSDENSGVDQPAWSETALLVMSHTWFHFDQQCLTKTILDLRPALLLVDIYSTWDWVVNKLKETGEWQEHGKLHPEDQCTYWLRSELDNDKKNSLWRGLWKDDRATGEPNWVFRTKQSAVTTIELFGGVERKAEHLNTPEKVLIEARTSGMLVDVRAPDTGTEREAAYVRQRVLPHRTGWGMMDCHVLVARSRLAEIFNDAYFSVIRESIYETALGGEGRSRISKMIQLFDDPNTGKTTESHSGGAPGEVATISGSREALVTIPFDPSLLFGRIVPLFKELPREISKHPLLIEHPNRVQIQYPSANGLFQTCFSRSSSVQAFATQWASDYELTEVDRAIQELEVRVLGLNEINDAKSRNDGAVERKPGCWRDEQDDPSYFMLPIYYGSLPMFCLALKFPQPFDPATTSFDVYYSTLKSLHDDIHVLLSEEKVRLSIIRPWIEACLRHRDWPAFHCQKGVAFKIEAMEEHLFGHLKTNSDPAPLDYSLDPWTDSLMRTGGVLGRHWKSWVLGLPSFPIKDMAAVKAMNKNLWGIWEKEKNIALLNPALRISLWFQEGNFFEDGQDGENSHDDFICDLHLGRLRRMFQNIGFKDESPDNDNNSWIERAAQYLRDGVNDEGSVRRYFGAATTSHFLFNWLCDRIQEIHTLSSACSISPPCPSKGDPNCPRHKGPFLALKSVFCKSRANKGEQVRFSLHRLFHVLDAARFVKNGSCGNIEPPDIKALTDNLYLPKQFGAKFWSLRDPTILLGEFVQCLAKMEILQAVNLLSAAVNCGSTCLVAEISLSVALKRQMGGNEADRLRVIADELVECGVLRFEFEEPTTTISIQCAIGQDGDITS